MANEHIGSSFDDFLKEDGIYEESQEIAAKRVESWKLTEEQQDTFVEALLHPPEPNEKLKEAYDRFQKTKPIEG